MCFYAYFYLHCVPHQWIFDAFIVKKFLNCFFPFFLECTIYLDVNLIYCNVIQRFVILFYTNLDELKFTTEIKFSFFRDFRPN